MATNAQPSPDVNQDGQVNLTDTVLAVQCNYCDILLQNVKNYQGVKSAMVSGIYNADFDLNQDAVINLSDVILATNAQPSPDVNQDGQVNLTDVVLATQQCPVPVDQFCGDGEVNGAEECDGGEPVACVVEVGGYAGTKSCHMPSIEVLTPQSIEPIYCVFNPCVSTEYCGDEIKNGTEECDAGPNGSSTCTANCTAITPPNPQPGPSGGGGGGGGFIPINIFNVQSSVAINSANITWETTRASLTWMLYGTSTSYGSEYQNTNYHATHTIALADLLPNTTYHYQIRAKDSGNHTSYDIDRTFTTLNTSGQLPPQVLGIKEIACKPDIDGDIKGIMEFITGSLVRGCGPEVYHVLGNEIYHIPNWQYLHDNYFAQRIYNVTDEVIAQYVETKVDNKAAQGKISKIYGIKLYSDGTLLRTTNGKIYVISNGKKMYISNLDELKKYAGNKMYNVTDAVLNQY